MTVGPQNFRGQKNIQNLAKFPSEYKSILRFGDKIKPGKKDTFSWQPEASHENSPVSPAVPPSMAST